jgi:hypothetical protein
VVVLTTGDDDKTASPPSTSSSSSSSSSSTTTAEPPLDTSTVVWPAATSNTRYPDPVAAARGFAADYVGFASPVVGEFRQGDARSGEVDIQPVAGGPVTTVLVRQLGPDDSWWVLSAFTANIEVTAPAVLTRVASPVTLGGTSTAFEATVEVEVREDGNDQPIGSGFVMGGANGELGPFHSTLVFEPSTADAGAIVFFTVSSEDGGILEAAVVRVSFA